MQFLTVIKTILSILPLIVQAITTIEQAFPQSGQGSNKLELIKQTLLGASEVSEDVGIRQFETMWPALQKTISAVVSLANASGLFKKG